MLSEVTITPGTHLCIEQRLKILNSDVTSSMPSTCMIADFNFPLSDVKPACRICLYARA